MIKLIDDSTVRINIIKIMVLLVVILHRNNNNNNIRSINSNVRITFNIIKAQIT